MPRKPERWTIDDLRGRDLGTVGLVATPAVQDRVGELPYERFPSLEELPDSLDSVIIVGGGSLIDRAKVWRVHSAPATRLIAIPSLWGSGAEASPIVVLAAEAGKKEILRDDAYVPDVRIVWKDLAADVPTRLARAGCGDVWGHALEGFLSPLATEALRAELATTIRLLLELPLAPDARWFDASAAACAGQAAASVGLAHALAHVLEGPLRERHPRDGWGHARLVSTVLLPVMMFNDEGSRLLAERLEAHELDRARIFARLDELFDAERFEQVRALLPTHWREILRDVSSRTNSVVVKPRSESYFMSWTR